MCVDRNTREVRTVCRTCSACHLIIVVLCRKRPSSHSSVVDLFKHNILIMVRILKSIAELLQIVKL